MIHEQKFEIGLNKKKFRNGFITSTCLAILGLILFSSTNNQIVEYGAVFISVLFFSSGIFHFLRKLADKKPGILIDDKGIQDNSSVVSFGFINWNDVKKFTKATAFKQDFLVVEVNNPDYYIKKEANFLIKKGMRNNFKHYGSPLIISANLLNCNLDELIIILEKRVLSRQENITDKFPAESPLV
jgi:hypothetical protein